MWLPLSIATAFFAASSDAFCKLALKKEKPQTMAMVRIGWGALFMAPLFFIATPPADPAAFWKAVLIAVPLEIVAAIAYQKSLHLSPLSLSVPYLAFTPVFVLLWGWLFLGEIPSVLGFSGIFLVVLGAFFLQTQHGLTPLDSLKRTYKDKGALYMLLVAVVYSITSALGKKAVLASSPLYLSAVYYTFVSIFLFPIFWKTVESPKEILNQPKLFAAIGGMEAAAFVLQFHAFTSVNIAYAISIKRLSLLIALLYGRYMFKETNLLTRSIGVTLMLAGAILIAFH